MKNCCRTLLLLSLFAVACQPTVPKAIEAADVEDLPPFDPATQQALALLSLEHSIHFLESNPKAILLDIRGREEYDKAHLPGAVYFPYDFKKLSIEEALESNPGLGKRGVYFIYGSKENFYVIDVAHRFIGSGHQYIFVMSGGIEDWIAKGLPVETTAILE
ncbi:MAG: hypothetical protein GXP30_15095 [Verrucomicrobia bacterium]|nr:hypothetical protein [Verrucomicrobiota bacterium]